VLERAVLHELGVEPAVGAVVDVLEEHAVQRRADGMTGFVGIDDEPHRRVGGQGTRSKNQGNESGQAGEFFQRHGFRRLRFGLIAASFAATKPENTMAGIRRAK
jgi:hypothetical protein